MLHNFEPVFRPLHRCYTKNALVFSQSESSNFCMYIITNINTVEEKQKYHITSVLPNSPENVFLVAFVLLKLSNEQTSKNNFPSEGGEQTLHMASFGILHRKQKMFLNINAIADKFPDIQFSLTTVRDASLPGVQTYFIYSSRILGKPSLISIEKVGF